MALDQSNPICRNPQHLMFSLRWKRRNLEQKRGGGGVQENGEWGRGGEWIDSTSHSCHVHFHNRINFDGIRLGQDFQATKGGHQVVPQVMAFFLKTNSKLNKNLPDRGPKLTNSGGAVQRKNGSQRVPYNICKCYGNSMELHGPSVEFPWGPMEFRG